MILINHGTHAVASATLANAQFVSGEICKDLGLSEKPLRVPSRDADGWFGFDFVLGSKRVDVDIPGDDPETVCEGRPLKARRLYVAGSSWLYGYALNAIARRLGMEDD